MLIGIVHTGSAQRLKSSSRSLFLMVKRFTENELEKRRQRRVMFFGIFMIVVMLMSTLAYYITTPTGESQMEYGDYEFYMVPLPDLGPTAGYYATEIDGQEIQFQSLPIHVTYLELDPQAIALLQNAGQVALSASTNESLENASNIDYARLQLGLAIPKAFNAMADNDERYTLPVFTCAQATPQLPVLLLNSSNQTGVRVEGACIILNAESRQLMQYKDRIIFEYHGILKNGEVVDD
jgi:hypothetical protein